MNDFLKEYQQLNPNQREAVDHIDGPMLVIAGPGTGKTQLLSARVANILDKTDSAPQNIICLTFTESGAQNMRDRLTRFIGQDAYHVNISTYHSFGSDLISRFPEYFTRNRMQEPIDQLGKHRILEEIVDKMDYTNPLKQTRHHLRDLISTISEVKRSLLEPADIKKIGNQNSEFIEKASSEVSEIFKDLARMPGKIDKALPYYEKTLVALNNLTGGQKSIKRIIPISTLAVDSLALAIESAIEADSSKPLTEWKNNWMAKDADGNFIIAGKLENDRFIAVADVLKKYSTKLDENGFYDFDDMIIESIRTLEDNSDLRYSLQEQYLYILLDEFQDTNSAQLKLVELLTDNPVNEGRPNVMAVGDDDQAIYSFQGARYSNMLDFYNMYKDVKVINLNQNYRSHSAILEVSANISNQINERLHHSFTDLDKSLQAAKYAKADSYSISRNEFKDSIAENNWIAVKIKDLIESGVEPREIAVIAPRHKHLEPMVPYLNSMNIPVRYEKRENILEATVIKQLLNMCRLVVALSEGGQKLADSLWPEVLSYEFWDLPITEIWKTSWEVSDSKNKDYHWSDAVLKSKLYRKPALLLLSSAAKTNTETAETLLDYLIGTEKVKTGEKDMPTVKSPLRDYYTSEQVRERSPELFYETLSELKVIREKFREHQKTIDGPMKIRDLLGFIEAYESADEKMINTSPYNQAANAVQIMTVFKAKGLEFEHVFLPCCTDDAWGSTSRGNSNRLTLPKNLHSIRQAGVSDDERLRIFFVAVTRAKEGLYLTSYTHKYNGKTNKRLVYLNEQEHEDGWFLSKILPIKHQKIVSSHEKAPELKNLELDWRSRHHEILPITGIRHLLEDRLKNYKLSPTHLNSFVDTEYNGPIHFFYTTILRFPEAPSISNLFGSAIHETMEWVQNQTNLKSSPPSKQAAVNEFQRLIKNKRLLDYHLKIETERGVSALDKYLGARLKTFKAGNKAEHSFAREGVVIDGVRMSGKIDLIEIDESKKEITVVDYKTGKPYEKWLSDTKLHRYKQQLYCYKLLIVNSATYKGYKVTSGRLEFIEPNKQGHICNMPPIKFEKQEMEHVKKLIKAMWHHVMNLEFPDISEYSNDLKGIKEFEEKLINSYKQVENAEAKQPAFPGL